MSKKTEDIKITINSWKERCSWDDFFMGHALLGSFRSSCHRLHFGRRLDVGGEIIDIRKPINTIICSYAHCPRFFVPLKNKNGNFLRCLLPDELKQIQGFPEDYKLSGDTGKQIKQDKGIVI